MTESHSSIDRVVIGGGLFGAYAALLLADQGHAVLLVEQGSDLMTRASFVNQARLHTGLHYPRSILTANEALKNYRKFRSRFPEAVRDFTQIYAVAEHNTKTTGADFSKFIGRIEQPVDEIDANQWFHPATVSRAFRVTEPSFDASVLRKIIASEIETRPNIKVMYNTAVIGGSSRADGMYVELNNGEKIETGGVVIATYASTNSVRHALGLAPLALTFELAEVILGRVSPELHDIGFTVMDGPFWSLMPFGHTNQVTLTSVGLTPLRRSKGEAVFDCQQQREGCTPLRLADCSTCQVRPDSVAMHQYQQMDRFLKNSSAFTFTGSLLTVKAILTDTEVDDARPTLIRKETDSNTYTIFSGKISTLFDLEEELE